MSVTVHESVGPRQTWKGALALLLAVSEYEETGEPRAWGADHESLSEVRLSAVWRDSLGGSGRPGAQQKASDDQ